MIFAYTWDFSFVAGYLPLLWHGVELTLALSVATILLTFILGTALGIAAAYAQGLTKTTTLLLIDIFRSIPLIVLLLWFYYLLPVLGWRNLSSFWPAVLGLTINSVAFYSDLIRASIEGLPKGSLLAARALGMDFLTTLRRIVLPEVYRETFASATLSAIAVVRFSSLASAISVYELTHTADYIIATTYKPLEVYTVITVMYLVIILPMTIFSRKLEKNNYFLRRAL